MYIFWKFCHILLHFLYIKLKQYYKTITSFTPSESHFFDTLARCNQQKHSAMVVCEKGDTNNNIMRSSFFRHPTAYRIVLILS